MKESLHFFPKAASSFAGQIDALSISLLVACGAMLALLSALILYFCVRYRKGSRHSRVINPKGETALEWFWTFATLGIFMVIFVAGTSVYFEDHIPPAGATQISVVGKQWMWKFQHANGVREINELHVPFNAPIILSMTSQDVIHSLYIPAFRIKQDVLPDRYTQLWFKATQLGEFHLFCAQYCGSLHSGMRGKVVVLTAEGYQRWLATQSDRSAEGESPLAATRGRELFTRFGCISCHGGQNPSVKAPALEGIYGHEIPLSDGSKVWADENYLRESILNPGAKIVEGYQNIMPPFKGVASEEDVLDLISYIKSLH